MHFFKRKLFSWGKKIGQLYQQSWLWEARFITSGLMGCEKLALLSARRPLLLPLRGLRSCQEEAAIPDCSVSCLHSYNVLIQRGLGSVKLGGLLLVLTTHTLAFSPLCKRWCHSHLPRLSLRGIIRHPAWLLALRGLPLSREILFFVDIFSAKSAEVAGSCATAHRSDALHRGHVGGHVLVMRGSKAWSDGGEKLPWTEN